MENDRRENKRLCANDHFILCEFEHMADPLQPEVEENILGQVVDFSFAGTGFTCKKELSQGEVIRISGRTLFVPGQIHATGKVIWLGTLGDGRRRYGVRILDFLYNSQDILKDYLHVYEQISPKERYELHKEISCLEEF